MSNALKLMNKSIREQFGKRLRRLIRARRFTQREIAFSLGIKESYLHRVLAGNEFLSNKAIAIAAAKLDVSVHDLFEGIEIPNIVHFALIEEKEESYELP